MVGLFFLFHSFFFLFIMHEVLSKVSNVHLSTKHPFRNKEGDYV